MLVLQSAPADVSGEAEGSDSDEVLEPTADTSGEVEVQLPAPEPAGGDGESSEKPEEDEDELKQVSDLRAESKVCGCVTSVLQQPQKKPLLYLFFLLKRCQGFHFAISFSRIFLPVQEVYSYFIYKSWLYAFLF